LAAICASTRIELDVYFISLSPAPLCPVHKTVMQVSKFGGYYCPRKNADGSHCKHQAA
jgi:hypothetical protein